MRELTPVGYEMEMHSKQRVLPILQISVDYNFCTHYDFSEYSNEGSSGVEMVYDVWERNCSRGELFSVDAGE